MDASSCSTLATIPNSCGHGMGAAVNKLMGDSMRHQLAASFHAAGPFIAF
jgi:hypothetical protein